MTASKKSFLRIVLLLCTMCFSISYMVEAQDFVLVIDAGHGGHDPGAIGKKAKEKDINLNVALKLGKMVQENCPDVKVIYTRSKDVFVSLNRRAEIANNAKADLFLSIHTNSVAGSKTVMGASTWTLGLAKSDANLDVAKRENSVILYEDDYKTSYAGFDPNSAESYIIFEFMQDNYMSQSVHLASLVQNELKNTSKRRDQGVHQAGFLVLKASAMPSILVELGFISTPAEELFLASESGATTMAKGIFRAFQTYKREQETKQGGTATQQTKNTSLTTEKKNSSQEDKKVEQSTAKGVAQTSDGSKPVFMIQFLTAGRKLANNDRRLSGLPEVDFFVENGTYKYTCGASTDYNKVKATLKDVTKRYKDAFIIAFREEKKINVNDAIKEFSANK